ncbi:MAG: diaminopimelate decarboxylase [Gemmatimonadaceae bacterium]|nr:diaminopimelate decarboxylase [Gemmatimonadaceae bacterium]
MTPGSQPLGFRRVDNALHVDGVALSAIADAVGTPSYVYSANIVRARYARLAAAFQQVPHRIHYAMKANSSRGILLLLRECGAGVDIVSGGELFRAQQAGFSGGDVVFSGVGKTVDEIGRALDAQVQLINVESEAELLTIDAVAGQRNVVASIAIRVNPEVTVDTPHAYIKTGEKGGKFGIPRDDVTRIAQLARECAYVELRGIGMHLGSQIANADPMREALPLLLELVERVHEQGHPLRFLDIGGGLSVPYTPEEAAPDVEGYADLVIAATRPYGLQLLLEPGRYLVADAGTLLTRVLYRKHAAGKDFVVTDAGMNDLIRPALYQAHHEIEAVQQRAANITADVVGPICESGDFFAKGRVVPDVEAGDLLAIRTTGAYGYTMASHYNSRPRPTEVLVDDARFAVVTERELLEDLVRLEPSHPIWRSA